MNISPIVQRFVSAPYGHRVRRDDAGLSHVTLYGLDGRELVTIVAPTFDEAVTRALDSADDMTRAARERREEGASA